MKKILLSLFVTLSCFTYADDETGGENLVGNGDFERNGSWKYIDARRQSQEANRTGNSYCQLNYSSKLGKKANSRNKRWTEATQRIHLKANSKYQIKFKIRGSINNVIVGFRKSSSKGGSGTNISGLAKQAKTGAEGWKTITLIHKTPKKAVKKEWLTFFCTKNNSFAIDDISVIKL